MVYYSVLRACCLFPALCRIKQLLRTYSMDKNCVDRRESAMASEDRRGRPHSGVARRRRGGTGKRPPGGRRDGRRLAQLVVSLTLFFLVFVGRGVFPDQIQTWREIMGTDMDFQGAVSAFLDALGSGAGFRDAVAQLGGALLGEQENAELPVSPKPKEIVLLTQTEKLGFAYASHAGVREPLPDQPEQNNSAPATQPPEPEPSPEIVTAVAQAYTDDGVALPSNVSLAYYELGLEETAAPVQGTVTSNFGYRDSPIDGDNEFHLALDIGAAEGTPIGAFAAGTVEYIGQSDEFGLYLKIRHANNVASFYAHCSQLLVSKGDEVACGQTVALVGSTGNATGPHLHLTIEKDDIRLNPAYYVDLS